MICCTPMHEVCNYGVSSQYLEPPSLEQALNGVIPLDSLPAEWWNWLWNDTNNAVNEAREGFTSLLNEFNTLLSCANVTPNQECIDQVYTAINRIRQTIATSAIAGAVKSSNVCGNVTVNNDGTMTTNGLGNVGDICYGNYQNVVQATNCFRNWSETCFSQKADTMHASEGTGYGVGNVNCYGHVKLSDVFDEVVEGEGIAASQQAVYNAYSCAVAMASTPLAPIDSGASDIGNTYMSSAGTSTYAARADHKHGFTWLRNRDLFCTWTCNYVCCRQSGSPASCWCCRVYERVIQPLGACYSQEGCMIRRPVHGAYWGSFAGTPPECYGSNVGMRASSFSVYYLNSNATSCRTVYTVCIYQCYTVPGTPSSSGGTTCSWICTTPSSSYLYSDETFYNCGSWTLLQKPEGEA